ncbi:TDP-N-acetylfucosamine:lipid II N-acetylfucosaminyltransferase [Congregibacter variabilis]|uniref:TDP-N-acetylfucosamine:lipid II N-acetylfucosaminyltransferase n=1 Tax=Congregibacter variabilis TaxID=3081200 RepID=A0ABZ0I362_9GAMM|nr:TDP-N-acetylfucosamine:lipid II N-acetylfucosaminyltransferase [Congregibacter sp. IMCC43200]
MKELIHIVPDEKFIEMAVREFEIAAPGKNRILVYGKRRPLKYLTSLSVEFMGFSEMRKYLKSGNYKAVVLHWMNDVLLRLIQESPQGRGVLWIGWGIDYYEALIFRGNSAGLYLPKTRRQLAMKSFPLKPILSKAIKSARRIAGRQADYVSKYLDRLDYFAPVLDVEYDLVKAKNPDFKAQFLDWNYGTLEDDLYVEPGKSRLGDNVLLGNSASYTNNHLETFDFIENSFELDGRKLIVPLSYGDNDYADFVIRDGKKRFGSLLMPLTEFLPASDYAELVSSCGYAFMNHLRQQAVGNIVMLMLGGSKVYLNPANPFYTWVTARGGFLEQISLDSRAGSKMCLGPLPANVVARNQQIVVEHWSREASRRRTGKVVKELLGSD